MSFECPHLQNGICDLNELDCEPGKGKCVLKGRFEFPAAKKKAIESFEKKKEDLIRNKK